ncbi:MAG: hypothetical protein AAFU56_06410 [Pseudomonadota bacterium]
MLATLPSPSAANTAAFHAYPPSQPYSISGFDDPAGPAFDGPMPLGRIIRSVVEEAGLGRFIYLQGRTGQRYVFSSIEGRQAGMYRDALFAVIDDSGAPVLLTTRVEDVEPGTERVFVHLLKDETGNADDVISDIRRLPS